MRVAVGGVEPLPREALTLLETRMRLLVLALLVGCATPEASSPTPFVATVVDVTKLLLYFTMAIAIVEI